MERNCFHAGALRWRRFQDFARRNESQLLHLDSHVLWLLLLWPCAGESVNESRR
jgi:hypothetical protein